MNQCIICLDDDTESIFEDGCPLNKCNVKHCKKCKEIIGKWIEMNNSCPKCRRLIESFEYEKYEYYYLYTLLMIVPSLLCIFSKTLIVPIFYYVFLCLIFLMCIICFTPLINGRIRIFYYMILCNVALSLLGFITFLLIILCIII